MDTKLTENKTFDKIDFTTIKLIKGEYYSCVFINCNFYGTDISNFTFNECEFRGCDLSLSKVNSTILNDVKFFDCKLLGLHFKDCNDFVLSIKFENCSLKLSTFYKLKLKKTIFKNCNLQEVDFAETDLTSSIFDKCDLKNAIFSNTNLEKVDFYSSFNYSFDPEKNRIRKARFSRSEVIGLLDKYNIEID
jgi:fluoroquinolone resistance protein